MSQTHTPTGGDSSQDDFGAGDYDPALWQPEPEFESAGSWLSSFLRNPGRTINRAVKKVFREVRDTVSDVADGVVSVGRQIIDTVSDVGGTVIGTAGRVVVGLVGGVVGGSGTNAPPPPELNLGPRLEQNNVNFVDGDSDPHHNALRIGQRFDHTINPHTFTDAEGDPITISLSSDSVLPPGINFDAATGRFHGVVGDIPEVSGTRKALYVIRIVGTDTHGRSTNADDNQAVDTIEIQVARGNRAPEISGSENREVHKDVGQIVRINLGDYFSDPDGDRLVYSFSGDIPAGFAFYASAGVFQGIPTVAFDGVITFTAIDRHGASAELSIRLNISQPEPPNNAPIPGTPIVFDTILAGEDADFVIPDSAFQDADDDILTLTATGLPDGLAHARSETDGVWKITGSTTVTGVHQLTITATDPDAEAAYHSVELQVREDVPVLTVPPVPAPQPDPVPVATPTTHRAVQTGAETLTGTDGVDIFIPDPVAASGETNTDTIRNFQQGTDKIHLAGITSVHAYRNDSDGDGTIDQTVLLDVSTGTPKAWAVLAGFTGTLTVDDFDASALDPTLVSSVTEVTTTMPDIA